MKSILFSISAVLCMIGLAITMRTDLSYSLWIGIIFLITAGILFYLILRIHEKIVKKERDDLLSKLSEINTKTVIFDVYTVLKDIKDALELYNIGMGEQITDCQNTIKLTNDFIAQIPNAIQNAINFGSEQQIKTIENTTSVINKTIVEFSNAQIKLQSDVLKSLNLAREEVKSSNHLIVEQIMDNRNINVQSNDLLSKIDVTMQTVSRMQLEQQSSMLEILADDVRNVLSEFTDAQSRTSEDTSDNVRRSMKSMENALRELISSLEQVSTKNTEVINNSIAGYKHFEELMTRTLEQMTSISNQDYDLLKGLLK